MENILVVSGLIIGFLAVVYYTVFKDDMEYKSAIRRHIINDRVNMALLKCWDSGNSI